MNQQDHYDSPTKSKRLFTLALKRFSIVMILIIIAALSVSTMIAKVTGEFSSEKSTSETVKLKLENIGLLATQSAYCKEVLLVENDRKISEQRRRIRRISRAAMAQYNGRGEEPGTRRHGLFYV